jgi:hypothetical protein
MPTAYIQKLHKQGKGSIAELEHKWETAKKAAAKQGHKDDYAYITGILNKMVGASFTESEMKTIFAAFTPAKLKIEAAHRLRSTKSE